MKKLLNKIFNIQNDSSPCPHCLQSDFTRYLKLVDRDKMIEARRQMLLTQKTQICSFPLPRILGANGHANYIFHGQSGEVDVDNSRGES